MGAGSSAEANGLSNSSTCNSTLELFDIRSISLSAEADIAPPLHAKGIAPRPMATTPKKAPPNQTHAPLATNRAAKRGSPPVGAAAPFGQDEEVPTLHACEEIKGLPVKVQPHSRARVKGQRSKAERSSPSSWRPLREPLPECLTREDRHRITNRARPSCGGQHSCLSSYGTSMADALAAVVERRKKTLQRRPPTKETQDLLPQLEGKRGKDKGAAGADGEVPWRTRHTRPNDASESLSRSTSHSPALPVFASAGMPMVPRPASTMGVTSGEVHSFCLFSCNDQSASTGPVEEELHSFIDDGGYGTFLADMKLESSMSIVTEAAPAPQPAVTQQLTAARVAALSAGPESSAFSLRPPRARRSASLPSKRSRRGSFVSFGGEVRLV
ncbi:hypothetical protein LSCM1_01580 [Leishmania martiniquensis]|uniref:Uncharacterized protein n=1 Tax=Leishmania martiniquensis TaxID=1580590 RepID=A0A836KMR8_9TRYP|nr:hypothetical protein LSCM1_01580 [Leishmania martiniquensis]